MINREIITTINKYLKEFPVIVILGPRQVGKTTLVKEITKSFKKENALFRFRKKQRFQYIK